MDKPNIIRKNLYETLLAHSQEGDLLAGFEIWETLPPTKRILYPAVVLGQGDPEIVEEYFGGGTIRRANLFLDLAVQRKSAGVPGANDELEYDQLITHYADGLRTIIKDMEFDPALNIGGVTFAYNQQGNTASEDDVYGLSARVGVLYEDE